MATEHPDPAPFAVRVSVEQVEEGLALAPKLDGDGLIPCVTTDATTGEVLMLGFMNGEALQRTITTGEAHYWSRSRQCLWRKGAISGLVQKVVEMRIDDDQDAVWLRVRVDGTGASCHVGYRSCFYRSVELGGPSGGVARLLFLETRRTFDPKAVYGDAPNPTQLCGDDRYARSDRGTGPARARRRYFRRGASQALCRGLGSGARCGRTLRQGRIPGHTVVAALMTELMPRLVQLHGPRGAATVLSDIAKEVAGAGRPPSTVQ